MSVFVVCAAPCFMALLEKCKTFMWVIWKTVINPFGKAVSWRGQRQSCVTRHLSAGGASAHVLWKDGWLWGFPICWVFPVWPVGPSACRHQADGHEELFCMASRNLKAGLLFWGFFGQFMCCRVSTIAWHFLALSLLNFLDNLCVAKMCCRAQ